MNDLKVYVFKRKGRPNYVLQWTDPENGKQRTKSAGTPNRREAERLAGRMEKELREGSYADPSKVKWSVFREKYEVHAKSLSPGTQERIQSVLNVVERTLELDGHNARLAQVTDKAIDKLKEKLREAGRTPAAIACTLRHLKAALRWAKRKGLMAKVPDFDMPKNTGASRGRAITGEEFDRMMAKVPDVVIPKPPERKKPPKRPRNPPSEEKLRQKSEKEAAIVESWRHLLRGLWLSGLRIGEALSLKWDGTDDDIRIDFTGKHPVLIIPGTKQKNRKTMVAPMTPEFVVLLESVPESDRQGFVFRPFVWSSLSQRCSRETAVHVIAKIGKKAGVVVKSGKKPRYASAHDLRRSCLARWSRKLLPQQLKVLARHASLTTTLTYYVGDDAEAVCEALWSHSSDISSDISENAENIAESASDENASQQSTYR